VVRQPTTTPGCRSGALNALEGGVKWLFDDVTQAGDLGHAVKVSLVGPSPCFNLARSSPACRTSSDLLPRPPGPPAYQRLLARLKLLEFLGAIVERYWSRAATSAGSPPSARPTRP